MYAKEQGLPVYYNSPTRLSTSIKGSKSAFFTNPKRKPDSNWVRRITLVCMTLLLATMVYMQLRFVKADRSSDIFDGDSAGSADRIPAAGVSAANSAADATPAAPAVGYPAPSLHHLVLVAGHAVYTGVDYALATNESSWFLEEYQKIPGQAQTFLDHIRLGIETAAADPNALLLFSGGQTRQAAGPRSEGLSYWMVAEAAGWFGHPEVRSRAFTEVCSNQMVTSLSQLPHC
eukprot:GHUV01027129.1.p1 GENE.GHUV01027129.1~~GHUV01027129.1.p1  ORF type:complete len:232 (+),score=67.51 GHUV01027129.1:983-1678(+)